jgi:hypothetical protein
MISLATIFAMNFRVVCGSHNIPADTWICRVEYQEVYWWAQMHGPFLAMVTQNETPFPLPMRHKFHIWHISLIMHHSLTPLSLLCSWRIYWPPSSETTLAHAFNTLMKVTGSGCTPSCYICNCWYTCNTFCPSPHFACPNIMAAQ